ncbi:MAG: hypothetical protein ACREV6_21995 [Clostridium sp.]|uniref:phage tail protein n=1 Tax=Clostridium sp. TaxID=1506 RepID=UPI003D6D0AD9
MSDGTIIIDTSVNGSGAEKGIQGLSGKLGSMASGALGVASKVTAAMLAVATGAVVALTKTSVEQYAQFEQLTGGVQTLFKSSSDKVMKYADNAYKTAGMSANEYMSTITGFSASLLQGLGGDTKKAADIGNMAVTDMADNANKMGTGIGNIQTAYQGFAKQNYTMLDNLKLGYGGTKTEMQRLLVDAGKLTGVKYDMKNFSDVITAIHAIQTQTGITGTTAKEAASTIEGSLNMTKSAWANLLTGMADEESDFDGLIKNLVTSVGAFGENILPRIEVVINGIGLLIEKLFPLIIDKIPGLINTILPGLLDAGVKIVASLGNGMLTSLPVIISLGLQVIQSLITGLQTNLPAITSAVVQIMTSLVTGILQVLPQLLSVGLQIIGNLAMGIGLALPTLIPLALQCVMSLVNAIITNLPLLLNAGLQIITGLVTGILTALPMLIAMLPTLITSIVTFITTSLPIIIETGVTLLVALINGLVTALPQLIAMLPQIIDSIIKVLTENLPIILQAGITLLVALIDGLTKALPQLIAMLPQIIDSITTIITKNLPVILQAGMTILVALIDGLIKALPQLIAMLPQIINSVLKVISTNLPIILQAAITIIIAIIKGLVQALPQLIAMLPTIINTIVKVLTDNLPLIINAAVQIMIALIGGLIQAIPQLIAAIPQIVIALIGAFASVNWGKIGIDILAGIGKGLIAGIGTVIQAAKDAASSIKNAFTDFFDIHSPSRVMRDEVGVMIGKGMADGIKASTPEVVTAASKMSKSVMEAAKEWIDNRKYYNKLSLDEELYTWQQVQKKVKRGSEEQKEVDKEVYRLKNELLAKQADDAKKKYDASIAVIDSEKYYNKLTLEQELTFWKGIQKKYKAGTDARIEADKEVYRIKNELIKKEETDRQDELSKYKDTIDEAKYYNKMSLEEEYKAWLDMQKKYEEGTDNRKKADREVYRLKNELIKKEESDNQKSFSKAKESIDERKFYNTMSLQEEYDAWSEIQKKYKDGTKERKEAAKEVYRLENEINKINREHAQSLLKIETDTDSKRTSLAADYAKSVLDINTASTDKRKGLEDEYYNKTKEINDKLVHDIKNVNKEYDDAVVSRTQSLYNAYGLFDEVSAKSPVSGQSLIKNLQDQAAEVESWKSNMSGLSQKGIGNDLIKELTDMRPKSAAQIEALNKLSAPELDTYVKLWKTKHDEAKTRAISELEGLRLETLNKISTLNNESEQALSDYVSTWSDKMSDIATESASKLTELKTNYDKQLTELNVDSALQLKTLNEDWAKKIGTLKTNTETQFKTMATNVKSTVNTLRTGTETEFATLATNIQTIMATPDWNAVGANIILGITQGVNNMAINLANTVAQVALQALQSAKDVLGIHSPSTVFRDQIGKYMAQGVGVGFEDETKNIQKSMQGNLSDLVAKMKDTVGYETASITAKVVASNGYKSGQQGTTTNNDNGVTQNVTIVNPQNTPSENARLLKKTGRDLALGY